MRPSLFFVASRPLALLLTLAAASACGVDTDAGGVIEDTDDGSEFTSMEGALDSTSRPTGKGELKLLVPVTSSLTAKSGFHKYTFVATRGGWPVTFVEKSAAFQTALRVIAPNGRAWTVNGTRNAGNATWASTLTVTLPVAGRYSVIASSVTNRRLNRPSSRGEYTLSADGNQFCGGIAAFQCNPHLKCLIDGDYPDAGGSCRLPDACRGPADCAGLVHPMCVGQWSCVNPAADGVGQCTYRCGPPADECGNLTTTQCQRNPACEIFATGCENNTCQPGEDGTPICHACDPIPACRKRTVAIEGESCGTRGTLPCSPELFCKHSIGAICGWADAGGTCSKKPEMCTREYRPVCGCNGVTYSNECTAWAAGFSAQASGACR